MINYIPMDGQENFRLLAIILCFLVSIMMTPFTVNHCRIKGFDQLCSEYIMTIVAGICGLLSAYISYIESTKERKKRQTENQKEKQKKKGQKRKRLYVETEDRSEDISTSDDTDENDDTKENEPSIRKVEVDKDILDPNFQDGKPFNTKDIPRNGPSEFVFDYTELK